MPQTTLQMLSSKLDLLENRRVRLKPDQRAIGFLGEFPLLLALQLALLEGGLHEIAAAMTINVSAPLLFSAALARRHAGELRILHVSSGAARHPYPGWSIYGASKAALDHHARCVAADGRAKLRICALAPGVIDTDMQTTIRASDAADFPLKDKFVALKAEGRLSTPQGAARAAVDYLLSEKFGSQPVADLRELG